MGRPEGESSETPSYDQPGLGTDPAASYYGNPTMQQVQDQPPASYYDDPTMQQDQPAYNTPPPPMNDQPQPPPQGPQPQQQTFTRAPMPNPGPAQYPPGPVQFPPPSPQMNPAAYPPQQPAAYPPQQPPAAFPPPQNGPPPAAYPPQKPVMFPPPSPQQAQQYPPPPLQANFQPVQFPPPGQQMGYAGQMPPQSPVKPAAQGIPIQMTMPNSEGWRTGLFDCMEDPTNAAITFFFPCLTFGQIAEIVDNGQTSCATGALMYFLITSFIGLPCIYSCTYRTKLRSKFGLVEAPAPDWVVHFLCEACALCQAYRELNHRGLDPSLGWIGNVARSQQQQQMTMMPPQPQRMM